MADLPVGSEVAGCRIEAVAGEGGMGVVYVATQLALERRVALKVIAPDLARDPKFRDRFKSESLLAASIEHPNVIPVYEAGETEDQLYLVMRYVDGTDLRALIEHEGSLSSGRSARLLAQVAAALSAAHRKGLVHRDVKPANVLVSPDPEGRHEHAYLTDFGIARAMSSTSGVTRTGAVVGTVDYLSPERLEGERGDTRGDVYAFGCMLYETLAGDIPFPRDSDVAKMFAHMNAPVPSLRELRPDVPAGLIEVIERCMAKDPDERYADASEVARATSAAVGATPAEGTLPPPLPRPTQADRPPTQADRPPTQADRPPTQADRPLTEAERPLTEAERPPTAPEFGPTEIGAAPAAEPPLAAAAQPASAPPATDPDLSEATTGSLSPEAAKSSKKPRRVGLGIGLLAAAIVAAVLIVVLGGGSGGGTAASISIPGRPDGMTVAAGKAWVASSQANAVTSIDDSGQSGTPAKVGRDPDSLVGANGLVWVTNSGDGTVSRLDEGSGAPRGRPIGVGAGPEGIAAGDGSIWVANANDGSVTGLNATTGQSRGTAKIGGHPIGVATSPGSVWVSDTRGNRVVRLDARTGQAKSSVRVGKAPRGVAVSGDQVWVVNTGEGTVSRIDTASGRLVGSPIQIGGGPREIAAADGDGVWLTLSQAGQAIHLDGDGKVADRKTVGAQPVGIAVDDSNVWVASFGDNSVTKLSR